MPFKHGKATSVYLGGLDLSPYLNQADWSATQETAETTAFASGWKSYIAGQTGASASFAGFYDPTITDLETTLGVDYSLTTGILTYCQGGSTIGDGARLLQVATSQYAQSSPVGGVVAVKWDVQPGGPVGFGQVLHPMGTDTNTTTGAGKDDGAATSLGWIAHLQVTGITGGGTWVIKLQDSTVNSGYADVTGGAFTATAVKGAQRLVSATNTTQLRRWVLYVATRTGGSAGDSITFQLSYSRNS
jgi:hypothetical protein